MKSDLIPIKMLLYRRPGAGADWPDLNVIDINLRGGQPWSKFVDSDGIGWIYDKISNLGTGATNGTVCTLVPKPFAEAAVDAYPELISILTEEEFETFYNERSTVDQPVENLDTDILQGIAARVQLEKDGTAMAPSQEIIDARGKCLDPTERHHRGIRKNLRKEWKDAKGEFNVSVHPDKAKKL
ncbi:hypothetical protein LCGC14_1023760 [marine sediment metagenome]|uniref:Uncharacterized protein n=1 Tax=marine sediment metagenome TaxID=412755 RepID=A0A0F9N152_9ZZZZ|nr:hypothetical protein [Pricia sp.]